jgi:pimeloyl-ACP methyl ester carboxylesterase
VPSRRRIAFLNVLLAAAALSSRAQISAPAPVIDGVYAGTLQAGEAQLHLVLHLTKNPQGELHASLDSLDQAVYAIEATATSFRGTTLRFEVASVGAHFEGTVSVDRKTIEGQWSQGDAALPITFRRKDAPRKPGDALFPVEGLWQTALETHGMRLRFQLHVSHDTDGDLVASLDSLDQSVSGLPAVNVTQKENAFHFEVPAVAGSYDGTLNAAKNSLTGKWAQTGADATLTFTRSDQPLELHRPQTPARPFPYREEEVTFSNKSANVTLAGTLTLPKGTGPFGAAVLVAGSGPQDRDESISNHKPFLILGDYLARKGIAVLRYDKRGTPKSTGNADDSTTLDLAADTEAAIAYLKSRKEIDPAKIGIIGHSEGAIIAPYLASRSKNIPWLVLLGAPATRGEDTLLKQSELIARAGNLTEPQIVASLEFDQAAYDLVRQEKNLDRLEEKLVNLVKSSGMDSAIPPAALEQQLRMLTSPWFRFFLDYDPLPNLQKTTCPVLVLYGQKDLQVPAKVNMPLVQKALADAGNKNSDIRQLADLNHLFQHSYSGSPAEYAAIEETFAPEALQAISDWLLPQLSASK